MSECDQASIGSTSTISLGFLEDLCCRKCFKCRCPSTNIRVFYAVLALKILAICLLLIWTPLTASKGKEYESLVIKGNFYFVATPFAIFYGIVTIITFCFGCYCVVTGKFWATLLFGIACFVICLPGFSFGVIGVRHSVKNGSLIVDENYVNETFIEQSDEGVGLWNQIETEMVCCGLLGPKDYSQRHQNLPASCCREQGYLSGNCSEEKSHKRGCLRELKEYFRVKITAPSIGLFVAAVVQFIAFQLGLMNAFFMWHESRPRKDLELDASESPEEKTLSCVDSGDHVEESELSPMNDERKRREDNG